MNEEFDMERVLQCLQEANHFLTSTKEPCISTKEPCISAKEPCISTKELYKWMMNSTWRYELMMGSQWRCEFDIYG